MTTTIFLRCAGRPALRPSAQCRSAPLHAPRRTHRSLRPTDSVKNIDSSIANPNNFAVQSAPVSIWYRLGPLSTALRAFGRAQQKRPYVTQFSTAVVVYFTGDLVAQSIGNEEFDPMRTMRALTVGSLSAIPQYRWFMFLHNHFNFQSKLISLVTKVVVNQAVWTPPFNSFFFGTQALLSGASLIETWERIKIAVPISCFRSLQLWPAVTAFSFTYIDPHYRSIFAGFIAIGWQAYLSYLNQQTAESEETLKAIASSST